MSASMSTFLLTWLFWWAALTIAYAALLFGIDALLTAWRRRQEDWRHLRQELARIDRNADVSVQRIGAAFVVAQRLIREQASQGERL